MVFEEVAGHPRGLPRGHLRLPHVRHLAPLEQPLATSRILADFLEAVT